MSTKTKTHKSKSTTQKTAKTANKPLAIIRNDAWLEPYAEAIEGRHQDAIRAEKRLTAGTAKTLEDFANAHKYFGMHRMDDGRWCFREWAPNATAITLEGDFSGWARLPEYALHRLEGSNGVWEGIFAADTLKHGDLYKMYVQWDGGEGERIPAYATRVQQDADTKLFAAQIWEPAEAYRWNDEGFAPDTRPLLIDRKSVV